MFAGVRGETIEEEAEDLAEFENAQIWGPVCKWAVSAGHLEVGNDNATINYIAKPPSKLKAEAEAVMAAANAVKAMRDAGMVPADERIRVQWQMPIEVTPQTPTGAQAPQPQAREIDPDAPPELSYSETLAAAMNEHGDTVCPHGKHPNCNRCGVVERFEHVDGKPVAKWRAYKRAA
jgi:hypothetical protein